MRFAEFGSPCGDLLAVVDESGALVYLIMSAELDRRPLAQAVRREAKVRDKAAVQPVATQLDEYFAGTRTAFDVPLALRGTAFQQLVWDALLDIPQGSTCTYGELAADLGRPRAARAVGAANGLNPVSIIVPCHRLIGASGALTGYGGGLATKQWLLEHEARNPA